MKHTNNYFLATPDQSPETFRNKVGCGLRAVIRPFFSYGGFAALSSRSSPEIRSFSIERPHSLAADVRRTTGERLTCGQTGRSRYSANWPVLAQRLNWTTFSNVCFTLGPALAKPALSMLRLQVIAEVADEVADEESHWSSLNVNCW